MPTIITPMLPTRAEREALARALYASWKRGDKNIVSCDWKLVIMKAVYGED